MERVTAENVRTQEDTLDVNEITIQLVGVEFLPGELPDTTPQRIKIDPPTSTETGTRDPKAKKAFLDKRKEHERKEHNAYDGCFFKSVEVVQGSEQARKKRKVLTQT